MTDRSRPEARTAQPGDAPELARLNALFNGVNLPPEFYAARLEQALRADTPILVELDGRVVGIANLRLIQQVFYPEGYAELTELFVEEAFRHRGAGRALVTFAEELARQAGAEEIIILTDFYNHTAQMLYGALNYEHRDIALCKSLNCRN